MYIPCVSLSLCQNEVIAQERILNDLQTDANKMEDYVNQCNMHKQQLATKLSTLEEEFKAKGLTNYFIIILAIF